MGDPLGKISYAAVRQKYIQKPVRPPPQHPPGNLQDALAFESTGTATGAVPGVGPASATTAATPGLSPEAIERSRNALSVWLLILGVFGVGGLLLGQQELAPLVAVSGVVMAAHAAAFLPRF